MHSAALLSSSLLALAPSVLGQAMYSKNSPVLQVDAKSYDKLIAKSNYTSIVEFYAPWCGHCKNLKPAYEKAAQSLAGVAKVAAVNCDDESNKPFCGQMGVQGFPTLKIVKPSKTPGKKGHAEDYQGPRTAKGITDAVADKIFNYVMRLKDNDSLEKFLKKTPDRPKGLIFSEKGLVPAFVKTLAIDFLGSIDFGYVQSRDKDVVKKYGVDDFPAVLMLPGDGGDPVKFDGEVKKQALVDFFSKVTPPHPDALPSSASDKGAKSSKSGSKTSSSKASKSSKSTPAAASETLDEESYPQVPKESPDPDVSSDEPKPVQVPIKNTSKITKLEDPVALQRACLHTTSTTCILAISPPDSHEEAEATSPMGTLTKSLGDIASTHSQRGAKMFPFYTIDSSNSEFKSLADGLKLPEVDDQPQIIAVNAKKGWWTSYSGNDFGKSAVGLWIDGIRLGHISKQKIPDGLVKELEAEPSSSKAEASAAESAESEETEHVEL